MKIAIIGAGSAVFWLSLTRDFCTMNSAPKSTFTLVDIDKDRLDAVYEIGGRYIQELGNGIKLEKTLNRREALKDADFVVNTAMPGGHEHQEAMRKVGIKHGYYMGVDNAEHNFVWDYFTILGYKQYRLALDIARDMEELCPDAWLMQTANPIFEVATLLRRHSKIKTAGFCPGYHAVYHLMFLTGLSPAEADFQVAGFNHCIYLTKFRNKETGEDAYPLIDQWIKNYAEELWKNHDLGLWTETISPAAVDMYKLYRRYPIGDTARCFSWKYHYDLETAKRWYGEIGGTDSEIGLQMCLDRFQGNVDRMFRLLKDPRVKLTSEIRPVKGNDEFSDFIDAMALGEEKRLVLNIPNDGILTQFPNDLAIEVPVNMKDSKLYPEKVEPFPSRLLNFVMIPRMLRMEWALEAFESGDKEMLVENLIRDRRTKSESQARETIDDLLNLPLNADMKAHYR
ncbi:MAG TPA: alpha-glucosidase/alpha-galactosidase [Nitrososphaerales archaeon]|nr:alpha-glucosidase/alpha-galactosidase [Nitrososphaerales archaeon]